MAKTDKELTTQGAVDQEERHEFVAARLSQIRMEMNDKFLEMGMLLLEAFKGGYSKTLGYKTFEDFIEDKLKVGYRTGKYMMDVHEVFVQTLQAPRKLLCEVGWTKAAKLLPVVDQDNMERWLKFARDHKMADLINAIKKEKGGGTEDKEFVSFSVGVFEDEKENIQEAIELAARETGNDRAGYNLTRICQDYASEARARQDQAVPSEDEEGHEREDDANGG